MKDIEVTHECDVYMDDQGRYRAECAGCVWKSGPCFLGGGG